MEHRFLRVIIVLLSVAIFLTTVDIAISVYGLVSL